jgi:hypothetical protein
MDTQTAGSPFLAALRGALDDWATSATPRRTQADLATALAAYGITVDQTGVSRWVAGKRHMQPAEVFAVEQVIGLAPGALSRLLGYVPADLVPQVGVPDAIAADLGLTSSQRRMLIAAWRAARADTAGRATPQP